MESSIKKIEQNKHELTVELGKEELTHYVRKAEDGIAQEVQLDGFRKGKAPRDAVRKKVGDQYILEQALDIALRESLAKILQEKDLEVMKVAELNVKENSASKLVYTVMLTVFPSVKLVDLQTIKVKKKDVAVEKKEIEDALDMLRTSRSKFVAKEGEAEKGDRVEINFEVTSDGLPIEGGVSKSHPVVLGDNKFIPGFEDHIVGMKTGDEKKFSLNAPADYFHKSVAGKKLDFSVQIVTVQKIVKPELGDDFAREVGRFTDLKELEDNIKTGISEEKKIKEKQRLRLEILAKIFEESKIETPKDMVNERLNGMIAGFDNELHGKGMELSFYLAHLNKTEDDLRKEWLPEAEKQVGYALILRKLAKEKNITPTPEEIEEEANKMIQTMALRGEVNQANLDVEGLKEAIASDLANEKVFALLEKTCIA